MEQIIERLKQLYPEHSIHVEVTVWAWNYAPKYDTEITYHLSVAPRHQSKDIIWQQFASFQSLKLFVQSLETHQDTVKEMSEAVKSLNGHPVDPYSGMRNEEVLHNINNGE